jgi:hypothetical protein
MLAPEVCVTVGGAAEAVLTVGRASNGFAWGDCPIGCAFAKLIVIMKTRVINIKYLK